MDYYAHSTVSQDKTDWQTLIGHLENVADLAETFAARFDARPWGKMAGLCHDAGKACEAFQHRLEGSPARVDHSSFGARIAAEHCGRLGLLLSYAISGHHGGLPDGGEQESQLHYRLKWGKVSNDTVTLLCADTPQELSLPFRLSRELGGFSLSFFTRMVFSCLVDADFLDTEAFCSPEKAALRSTDAEASSFAELQKKLLDALHQKVKYAPPTPVNQHRQCILTQSLEKAEGPPGFYSLTVPTGGGKTLSSLAFALRHAEKHGLSRVIYAIPFTSIIEQNARVFQDILGKDSVLEHHCNYKESDAPEEAPYERRRGLASENWDAPLVVTTNVQLFESLFSNKPSRCRKLHNVAGSVIVLDEAQAIPTVYLEACLAALKELVEHYGCTVLLCTATQPALDELKSPRVHLPKSQIQEIIDDPAALFQAFSRTEVFFLGKQTEEELSSRLQEEKQVLCIVSTKPQARRLYEGMPLEDGTFHLSTNLYPAHRRKVLEAIRARLKEGKTCRVVSTTLVEAGVDLDFPVVYRAMAGLDSIAQAAGRCNREGRMEEQGLGKGKVFVFESEKPPRMPWVKRCASRASEALRSLPQADPLGLDAIRRYFQLLYDVEELDKKMILKLLNPELTPELYFPFKEVAKAFRFIEDETTGIIVAVEPEAQQLVQELRHTDYPRSTLRKLQQYSISVRSREFSELQNAGALEMIHGSFPLLCNEAAYSPVLGLCVDAGEVWDVEALIS